MLLPNNFTIATSLQLMINIILNHHFKNARCIVDIHSEYKYSLTSQNVTIPQYINASSCITGCDHYILHEPKRKNADSTNTNILKCFTSNREYTFKGIIFLDNVNAIEEYKFSKGKKYWQFPVYAANSIFVTQADDSFVIYAFDHWELRNYVVLNRWNCTENKFENETIDEFFSDERRKRQTGDLFVTSPEEQAPIAIIKKHLGSEIVMLKEFARLMNLKFSVEVDDHLKNYLRTKFQIGTYTRQDFVASIFPVTKQDLTFLVPKPEAHISLTTLISIFDWKLWTLIASCYLIIGLFFCIEILLFADIKRPQLISIVGVSMGQGLNDLDIPYHTRTRCLIAAMLTITVLYSAVFSSGVVDRLMTEHYENDIKTLNDLANSKLPIIWKNPPMSLIFGKDLTKLEKRLAKQWVSPYDVNYKKVKDRAEENYISITNLASHMKFAREESMKCMDEAMLKSFTNIAVPHGEYLLYIPLVHQHLLICQSAGLMTKWEWDAYRSINKIEDLLAFLDTKPPPSEPTILMFEHIQGVLGVWCVGIAFSMITFIFEHVSILLRYSFIY